MYKHIAAGCAIHDFWGGVLDATLRFDQRWPWEGGGIHVAPFLMLDIGAVVPMVYCDDVYF
jgi:hypothetical protein